MDLIHWQVEYGPRPAGTVQHDRFSRDLFGRLKEVLVAVSVQHFCISIQGSHVQCGNIIGHTRTQEDSRLPSVLLGTHFDTRPIADRVKESFFSVLYKYDLPNGKLIADLFCGVGSLGLEALSRGAGFVTFVETDPEIIAILEKNIEKAGYAGESKVIRANAFKIGAPVNFDQQKYGLVFVDPPYSATRNVGDDSPLSGLLTLLGEQVTPDGIVAVRAYKHTKLLEQYGRLEIIDQRRWGTMAVTILKQGSG